MILIENNEDAVTTTPGKSYDSKIIDTHNDNKSIKNL